MENTVPFVLDRAALEACNACDFSAFEKKSGGTHQAIYSDGWTEAETERLAKDNPIGLLFLVSKNLVPVTSLEARAAIRKASGESVLSAVMGEFRARGEAAKKKPASPPPADPAADTEPTVDVSPPARRPRSR